MLSMESTSTSLLVRLRQSDDREAWDSFVTLYGPLIFRWARRTGLREDDATDLVQDVMAVLVKKLPEFQYDKSKSFRAWLKTVTLNRWRDLQRRQTAPLVDATDSEIARIPDPLVDDFWDRELQQQVVARALALMEQDFEQATWEACKRYVFSEESPDDLAAEYGISVWTIYSAKSRLVKKLRDELDGMLD